MVDVNSGVAIHSQSIAMKKTLYLIILIIAAYVAEQQTGFSLTKTETQASANSIQSAYNNRQSDIQLQQKGLVTKVLADDLNGSRHQRFLIKVNALSLLIAHNIDLAPKIETLKKGDSVEFNGEYEWNEKGGIVHWTHHDPAGRHINGWLKHKGKIYQ